jgi:uncharacterized membrane protein YgcG
LEAEEDSAVADPGAVELDDNKVGQGTTSAKERMMFAAIWFSVAMLFLIVTILYEVSADFKAFTNSNSFTIQISFLIFGMFVLIPSLYYFTWLRAPSCPNDGTRTFLEREEKIERPGQRTILVRYWRCPRCGSVVERRKLKGSYLILGGLSGTSGGSSRHFGGRGFGSGFGGGRSGGGGAGR